MKSHRIQPGILSALLACATLLAACWVGAAAADPADAAAAAPAASTGLDSLLDQAHGQRSASGDNDFLPVSQAFQLSGSADSHGQLQLSWIIAPGYYLYRDRIKVASASPGTVLGAPQFPAGVIKSDPYFGKQVIYHHELLVTVPVRSASGATAAVSVTYQGCAEAGLCYPPTTRTLSIALPAGVSSKIPPSAATTTSTTTTATAYVSDQDRLAAEIGSGNLFGVLATFWGLGLLLAFTPCCLPMVPILSGLIAGGGQRLSSGRAFALSLTYVLGMAVTYTATGAAFAAAGSHVQAAFTLPWVTALFAALFVAMAASMFGLYTVQIPSFLQTRLAEASNRQQGGHFGGVAVMGALSALIVTTCVAPPLVATLAYIGQSGAIARGSAALFAMALGMGSPLLVVGTSAGRWLPKAGAWMDAIKRLFGVMMLALAAWMLTRIVPARETLLLFLVPAVGAGVVLWSLSRTRSVLAPVRAASLVGAAAAGLYAVVLLVGTVRGAENPLAPLSVPVADLAFKGVSSVSQLDREVRQAAAAGEPVMLDFYADWCTSCKEMQHYTFTDPRVRAALSHVRLLRADVTANNSDDQALLRLFQIPGPPTIAFYDNQGHELHRFRVVGYMNAPRFNALLQRALSEPRGASAG